MRILGIDPGSQFTGFGAIEVQDDRIKTLDLGVIRIPSDLAFADRLVQVQIGLSELLTKFEPQVVVVERIFLGRNADSAFKLGHVRGVCMQLGRSHGAQVVEYAARLIKKGVTGNGASSKEQVQMILFASLGLRQAAPLDASDALALAYYHARQVEIELRFQRRGVRRQKGIEI